MLERLQEYARSESLRRDGADLNVNETVASLDLHNIESSKYDASHKIEL